MTSSLKISLVLMFAIVFILMLTTGLGNSADDLTLLGCAAAVVFALAAASGWMMAEHDFVYLTLFYNNKPIPVQGTKKSGIIALIALLLNFVMMGSAVEGSVDQSVKFTLVLVFIGATAFCFRKLVLVNRYNRSPSVSHI